MKKLWALVVLAIVFSTTAKAEPSVTPLALGTPGAKHFSADEYCTTFHIRKTSGEWIVVDSADANLQNNDIELLRGCIGYLNDEAINAVVFSLAVEDKCATEFKCVVNGNNSQATGCHSIFMKDVYKSSSPRSKGYYSCNSNFANKGVFGAFNFDEPINQESFITAVNSKSVRAAASEFARSQYRKAVVAATQFDESSCGKCTKETGRIRFLFDYFFLHASSLELEAAAVRFVEVTGVRTLPNWMSVRLSPTAIASVNAKGEQVWRRKYSEQVKLTFEPGSDKNRLQAFVNARAAVDSNNWKTADFDGLVPKAKQMFEVLNARDEAGAKEREKLRAENEEKIRKADAAELAAAQRVEAQRLTTWRRTLKVGDDTFCGPVIEVKSPMVKIAVRPQLQGFGNEAWLKTTEVFPDAYGCSNRNGRLFPNS